MKKLPKFPIILNIEKVQKEGDEVLKVAIPYMEKLPRLKQNTG